MESLTGNLTLDRNIISAITTEVRTSNGRIIYTLSNIDTSAAMKTVGKNDTNAAKDSEDSGIAKVIKLPDNLESVPRAEHFPTQRHRWNTNEEIAAILICFTRHVDWLSKEVKIRPKSGSMMLYSRKKVRYRRDGYCWKKRKDGKTTREDHMKLKVQGTECIYGCYVHSAILPTFHRRCYWLLQNPDIVLVHYLNVPYSDDNKVVIAPSLNFCGDKKEWTKDELISQLKPMFFSENEPDLNNELEISTAETVESIVQQLMEKQRARAIAMKAQHDCPCDAKCDSILVAGVKATNSRSNSSNRRCNLATHRVISPKSDSVASSQAKTTSYANSVQKTAKTGNNNQSSASTLNNQILTTKLKQQPFVVSNATSITVASATNPSVLLTTSALNTLNAKSRASTVNVSSAVSAPPLILNLSQLQSSGGLLILNNASAQGRLNTGLGPLAFVCSTNTTTTTDSRARSNCVPSVSMSTTTITTGSVVTPTSSIAGDLKKCKKEPVYTSTTLKLHRQDLDNGNNNLNLMSANHYEFVSDDVMKGGSNSHLDENRNSIIGSPVKMETSVSDLIDNGRHELNLFDQETLDLSQEDIQRTLSANLPGSTTSSPLKSVGLGEVAFSHGCGGNQLLSDMDPNDLNPMDFIENDLATPDEDYFVNLDAFDMLADFPDLDSLTSTELTALGNNLNSVSNSNNSALNGSGHSGVVVSDTASVVKKNAVIHSAGSRMGYREGTANITDFSPDWAYPEGGVKVLVTGPWYSAASPYSVFFDSVQVPTTVIQSGVLRCYCPPHEPGMVSLRVACEGFVISNSVMFEYKARTGVASSDTVPQKNDKNWFTIDEPLFKYTLLEKMEQIENKLTGTSNVQQLDPHDTKMLEEELIDCFQRIAVALQQLADKDNASLVQSLTSLHDLSRKGLTLMHLACALGYGNLVGRFLQWRHNSLSNSSLRSSSIIAWFDLQTDALSKDHSGNTSLLWTCAGGHSHLAMFLCKHVCQLINVQNNDKQTAFQIAKDFGYVELARELEKLSCINKSIGSFQTRSKSHLDILPSGRVAHSESSFPSLCRTTTRLSVVSANMTPTTTVSVGGRRARLSKRSSVDSGINLTTANRSINRQVENMASKRTSFETPCSNWISEMHKLSRQDRSLSLPLSSVPSISVDCSPSELSVCNIKEEHRTNSPIVLMDTVLLTLPKSLMADDDTGKSGRCSSLGGISGEAMGDSDSNAAMMDITSANSADSNTSPLIDVVGFSSGSDDDNFSVDIDHADKSPSGAFTLGNCGRRDSFGSCDLAGPDSDSRVLTLAEQIIAALPDRIKLPMSDDMDDNCFTIDGTSLSVEEKPTSHCNLVAHRLLDDDYSFEFSDQNYRYCETNTPTSSLSPASSSCLQSPGGSSGFTGGGAHTASPPPTTADFCEFFQASGKIMEKDFSDLTLSDMEQRELYEAAKIIQKAYRTYKGRKQSLTRIVSEERDKEKAAAVCIQNYYRRYKQYAYFKQMTRAAMVIQNQFRSYCEHKRFKKSRLQDDLCDSVSMFPPRRPAVLRAQSNSAMAMDTSGPSGRMTVGSLRRTSREGTPTQSTLKRTYSQRRQHQAARKIQQFMRQSKNNTWEYIHAKTTPERACYGCRIARAESGGFFGRIKTACGGSGGPAGGGGGPNQMTSSSNRILSGVPAGANIFAFGRSTSTITIPSTVVTASSHHHHHHTTIPLQGRMVITVSSQDPVGTQIRANPQQQLVFTTTAVNPTRVVV